jgi:hypothetical protein
VDIVNSAHTCVGNAIAKRGTANDEVQIIKIGSAVEVWSYYSYLRYIIFSWKNSGMLIFRP